jgi:hypothetical protein
LGDEEGMRTLAHKCCESLVDLVAGAGANDLDLRCANQRAQKRSESNLIIRFDDATNQISIGAHFGNLKTYQRCATKRRPTQGKKQTRVMPYDVRVASYGRDSLKHAFHSAAHNKVFAAKIEIVRLA